MLRQPRSMVANPIGSSNAGHVEVMDPKYRRHTTTRRSLTTSSGCQSSIEAASTRELARSAIYLERRWQVSYYHRDPRWRCVERKGTTCWRRPVKGRCRRSHGDAGGLVSAGATMAWVVTRFDEEWTRLWRTSGVNQRGGGSARASARRRSAGCRRSGGSRDLLRRRVRPLWSSSS